jgi:hypothetical protein
MGLKIIGYDDDENPQYGWVDDDTDDYTANWDSSWMATTGQGADDIYSGSSSNIYPDGYGGYVNGNGDSITIVKDADGTLKTSTGQKLPAVDALGNQFQESIAAGTPSTFTQAQIQSLPGGEKFVNAIKGYFKKKDANGNIIKNAQGEDQYDWGKIIGAGTTALAFTGLNDPAGNKSGYQGGIPSLTAMRSQIPGTYDPNRRAGSGGQRYFSDSAYIAKSDTDALKEAKANMITNAEELVKQNKANPAYQEKVEIERTLDPATKKPYVDTGMRSFAPAAKPASGVATLLPMQTQAMKDSYNPMFRTTQPQTEVKQNPETLAYTTVTKADGGLLSMAKGHYLRGSTDGMADELNTTIDDKQPAKLSHGEFVIPADVVSHLGNGNSDAGAKKLYQMMDKIRVARTGTKKQGKQINPDKFMPGGSVKYSSGGGIRGFDAGGSTGTDQTTTTTTATSATKPATVGTESNLSNWVGPYATTTLGEAQALAAKPYEAYQGPLTADASNLQKQTFQTGMDLTVPVSSMGGFTPTSFGAEQAQSYMNPYLTQALNPQLEAMRLAHEETANRQRGMMGASGRGSALGGSAQAIMEAANNRNLLQEQNKTIGQGYMDAYNKAMDQFNKEQNLGLTSQEMTNKYGLAALEEQAKLGATQRAIESEGIAADRAQFEEEKLDPYKKLQFKQSMLQGLPTTAQQNNYAQQSTLQQIFGGLNDATQINATIKRMQDLGIIPK